MTNTLAENMQALWTMIEAEYKARGDREGYSYIRLSMFCFSRNPNTKYPKLKGRAVEIKSLGPVLLIIWKRLMDRTCDVHQNIKIVLKKSVRMDEILSQHKADVTLPRNVSAEFEAACFDYLLAYDHLASYFLACVPVKRLFNKTMKCHYLAHIGMTVRDINPRQLWCYRGEDSLGFPCRQNPPHARTHRVATWSRIDLGKRVISIYIYRYDYINTALHLLIYLLSNDGVFFI